MERQTQGHIRQSGRRAWLLVLVAVAALASVRPAASAGSDVEINVAVLGQPDRVPTGGARKVSVEPPSLLDRDKDTGIMETATEAFYNTLMQSLAHGCGQAGMVVLDRRDIINRQTEQRRARGRGGDPDEEGSAPRVFDAEAQIIPRLRVEIGFAHFVKTDPKGKIINTIRGVVPGGSFIPHVQECKPYDKMWVRVWCDIKMQFTNTGVETLSYSRMLEVEQQSDPGVLGLGLGQKQLAELPTAQAIANRLIDRHVNYFLSQMVPVRWQYQVRLTGCSDTVVSAVTQLNGGDLSGALRTVGQEANAIDKKDAHQAYFVAGLACELKGQRGFAKTWYARAVAAAHALNKGTAEYAEGLSRVSSPGPTLSLAMETASAR